VPDGAGGSWADGVKHGGPPSQDALLGHGPRCPFWYMRIGCWPFWIVLFVDDDPRGWRLPEVGTSNMMSSMASSRMAAQARERPDLCFCAVGGDGPTIAPLREAQLDAVHLEQLSGYCLTRAFPFGFVRMSMSAGLVELVASGAMTGRRPERNSGIMPYFSRSLGAWTSAQEVPEPVRSFFEVILGAKIQFVFWPTRLLDDVFQADERPSADEEDVRGVDLQELLLRVLAPRPWAARCRSSPRGS